MAKSKTFVAIPPGYTIKEQLDDRGIKQKEFALRMEMSEKHISKLINGEVLLTTDMALRLEMVLGISAQFWLNLENIYREKLTKIKIENSMDKDIEILKLFPYDHMVNLNLIPDSEKESERVINLRKFFEVSRLGLLLENNKLNVLCKGVINHKENNYLLMIWSQEVKLEARKCITGSININKLNKIINNIVRLLDSNSINNLNQIKEILAKCGIALIVLPKIGDLSINGITFIDGSKIVIGISQNENLKVSLLHELGHIVLGHIYQEYNSKMEEDAETFVNKYIY